MEQSSDALTESVIETLGTRGWCFGDIQQVRAIIFIHCALADDRDVCKVADSLEPELLNMDLRSIGGKSLPDPNRKPSVIQGPKVLQIASARDISRSSIEDSSGNSSSNRLLRLSLTDGHTEVTAVEYVHVPSIPNDVVPGTKVRLENKVVLHSGIICLKSKIITVLGGVVQSLHEEWQMNKKYSVFSRTSLRPSQEGENGGPPPFEKLQIEAPSHHIAQRGRFNHDNMESASKNKGPVAVKTVRDAEVNLNNKQQITDPNRLNNNMKIAPLERMDEKPSISGIRPKEVAESFPIQNQAASQKLLQKMSNTNQDRQYSRGRKSRGKEKQDEPAVFTLDEWEKIKTGATSAMKIERPDISHDEDLAWQLQNQLDLEDSHVQREMHDSQADNIKLSMFNYEREDNRAGGMEHRGRGRGREKGRGRGKGRGKGRDRW